LDCRIDFWSSGFTLAASAKVCLLLFSHPTAIHLSLMLAFHHIFVLAQILIFVAGVSRRLPIAL
jgi:hypothetical protein